MYKIRNANFADMPLFLQMAETEGWKPGLYDSEVFFAADKKGFFIGEFEGEPVSFISAVKYNDFGFIGFYIVKKEFRGRGFGLKIWQRALDYLKDMNIGLDGAIAQVENYKKSGFRAAHSNARYTGNMKINPAANSSITNAGSVKFSDLALYDAAHFGSERINFLQKWISQKGTHAFCYQKDDKIAGFGVCREIAQNNFKIGPLFADNFDIAEFLFLKLVSEMNGKDFYLDINESFKPAKKLVDKYNMTKVFETCRMYSKNKPRANWGEVFGITSFELG